MSDSKHTKRIWRYVNIIAKERNVDPSTVYLWAVKQVVPPKAFEVEEAIADEFVEHWNDRGIGFTAEKKSTNGEKVIIDITKGISGFTDEETEQIIKVLENVAFRYKISLLTPEENEKYLKNL